MTDSIQAVQWTGDVWRITSFNIPEVSAGESPQHAAIMEPDVDERENAPDDRLFFRNIREAIDLFRKD